MRSRRALVNTVMGMLQELVTIACGFVVPHLILSAFGSQYNGITSSITQFISCISLFRVGITGVTRAALYKPLAEGDTYRISAVVKSTELFFRKLALIFLAAVTVFAAIYPFMINGEFGWLFSFTLVLIVAVSTFVQYYFGIVNTIVLQADQRQGVLALLHIGSTVLNTVLAAVLIKCGAGIHVVKLGSAVAFSVTPIVLSILVRRKYHIDRSVEPDQKAISQRWDAFGHAVATFVHSNTDIVVLTVFTNLYEVSVYSVYALVCNGIKVLFKTLTASVGAAFGNMIAKNEKELMQKNMDLFEYVGVTLGTALFTVAGIMMIPFVSVYTRGLDDVNYIRPLFSFLMVLACAFFCFRIPYQTIVEAAGDYKQTRNGAFFEAFANVFISVVVVIKYGLIGVTCGTLFATVFRTVQYVWYLKNHILFRSPWMFVKQLATGAAISAVTVGICLLLRLNSASGYFDFALRTAACGAVCAAVTLGFSMLFYKKQLYGVMKMFLRAAGKKKKGIKA